MCSCVKVAIGLTDTTSLTDIDRCTRDYRSRSRRYRLAARHAKYIKRENIRTYRTQALPRLDRNRIEVIAYRTHHRLGCEPLQIRCNLGESYPIYIVVIFRYHTRPIERAGNIRERCLTHYIIRSQDSGSGQRVVVIADRDGSRVVRA